MMNLSICVTLLELAAVASAKTSSSTSSFSQSTVIVTGTATPTSYWVTPIGLNGGTRVNYHQLFTRYFSEIEQPRSGSIGLGPLSGTVGTSRNYPLATGRPVEEVYSQATASNSSLGVLRQSFDTDSRGYLKTGSAGWTSIAAAAGETRWYGPTITQTSIDTVVGSTTTGVYGGTYTFVEYTYGGKVTGAITVSAPPPLGTPYVIKTLEANGDILGDDTSTSGSTSGSTSTTSTSSSKSTSTTKTSTTTPGAVATSTSSTTTPGVAATSTTTPGVAAATSTTTPGVAATTSTTTPGVAAATSTTTPGVAAATSTTTPGVAAATSTTTPGVAATSTTTPGVAAATSTSTPGVVATSTTTPVV